MEGNFLQIWMCGGLADSGGGSLGSDNPQMVSWGWITKKRCVNWYENIPK